MDQVIDRLYISLGLNPDGVQKGLKKTEDMLTGGLKGVLKNFVAPLAAAFAGGKVFAGYTSNADAMGKMANALGINVEELHAWGEASARAGGSAEAFQSSVKTMAANLAQLSATGGGRAKAFFESIGVEATDAAGAVKPTLEVMRELSDKFEKMSKQQALGLGQKLGLDQGTIMLLQGGRRALDELIARQKELGVFTKRDAEITARFNDSVADLGQSFMSLAAILLRPVVQGLTVVSDKLTMAVAWLRKHEPFVIAFVTGVAAVLTAKLIPAVASFTKALLKNPLTYVILALVGLALALDDLYVYMKGGKSQFAAFWALFGTGEEIAAKLMRIWENLKGAFNDLMEAFATGDWSVIKARFAAGFEDVKQILKNAMRAALDSVLALFVWIFGKIKQKVSDIFTALTDAVYNKFDEVGQKIRGVWEGIVGWFSEKIEWFTKKAKAIKDFFGFGEINDEGGNPQGYEQPGQPGIGPNGNGVLPAPLAGSGLPPFGGGDTNVSTETTIGTVNVNTQATDAEGIAKDMADAVYREDVTRANAKKVNHANSGVRRGRGPNG
jgi:hypothetical protein